jgi:DNA-binding MarR family transcriptional regulator
MHNIIKHLINDFKESGSKYPNLKSFRASKPANLVWLTILDYYYENNPITVEQLISEIAPSFASRQTVKNILYDAIQRQYVIKQTHPKDKRKQILIPSQILLTETASWAKSFSEPMNWKLSILASLGFTAQQFSIEI